MVTSDGTLKKILVVEDEHSISDLCRDALTRRGFIVDSAANGVIAKKKVESAHYDVILLDIIMPEMNGIEFYSWLQAEYPGQEKNIVVVSGDLMRYETQIFIKNVRRPCLAKPFVIASLEGVIQEILDESNK